MKLIDMHSHWGTERGYVLRTDAELAQQKKTWNSEVKYVTEQEMADYFVKCNAQVILDLGFTKFASLKEIKPLHDYSFETQRKYPNSILGSWFHIDPTFHGKQAGLKELRRCIDSNAGFVGFAVNGSGSIPASDPAYAPFYKLCIDY